jgi:hypothetical protein
MTTRQNILIFIFLTWFTTCFAQTKGTANPKNYIWVYDYAEEIPVRLSKVNPDTLTPQKLISFINKHRGQGKIILDLLKTSNDTIYVAIKKSTYLTQKMGTTGADEYVSTTVYTLTELKGIKYVNFAFEEGDHARPGTYSRQYYINRNKRNKTNK